MQCIAHSFEVHGSANQLLLEKLSWPNLKYFSGHLYMFIFVWFSSEVKDHEHCLLSVLIDHPSVYLGGKTYFVTKLHSCGFSDEFTVQGVYTVKQTGMFTLLKAGLMLEHTMSWLVDVSGWRSMFSFPKSHRQMYWVAVHMTSQLPEGTVMQLDAKTCDICDPASAVMHSHEDAHERNASAARAALASLWSLSWHMTQFGCPHFLKMA